MRSVADMLGFEYHLFSNRRWALNLCLRREWSLGTSHFGFLSQYLLAVQFEIPSPHPTPLHPPSSIFLIYRAEIITTILKDCWELWWLVLPVILMLSRVTWKESQ